MYQKFEEELGLVENLKELRLRAGLTQTKAAKAAGVTLTCWQNWEKEVMNPSPNNAKKIKGLLGKAIREMNEELKQQYMEKQDEKFVIKADGNLSKLCNLRSKFDESFDEFFDRKELRAKYSGAWNTEDDEPNFDITMSDLETMLDNEDAEEYTRFLQNLIGRLDELD